MTTAAPNVVAIRPHNVALNALNSSCSTFRAWAYCNPHVAMPDAIAAYWSRERGRPPEGVSPKLWSEMIDCKIAELRSDPEFGRDLLESIVRDVLAEAAYELKKARTLINTLRPSTGPTWAHEMAELALAANELIAEIRAQSGAGLRTSVAGATSAVCDNG